MFDAIRADLRRTYEKVGGSRASRIVQTLRTPGVQAALVYRFGRWLKARPLVVRIPLEPVYYVLNGGVQLLWGIELPREAKIGPGLRISHFGGVIVSPFAVLGANCGIGNGVTIGLAGEGEKWGAPVIGDDVYIAAGAKVFGKIRVGNNVKIGANAVIHRDVPDNAVCALDPGFRILSFKGNRRYPIERAG
jgi:serine O-acetyltransferase